TTWHASFAVPTQRQVYNAADVLVAQSSWAYNVRGQALTASRTDPVAGTTRTSTTTYCEQSDIDAGNCPLLGLVTSVDGPRSDVSDLQHYTYYFYDDSTCASAPTTCPHRKGDLWKVTSALGQVTEYLSYDGAGRVLSVKDANGTITDYTYHPRGWLTASKVRGADSTTESDDRITLIDYWPTGLVKQVTQPDGAFTAFTYDAAHRLTDIADNAGNTLHYTLDNAGNRVKEDTKDASGSLKRTLSRVYNQLGQLSTQATASGDPTDFGYDANGNTTAVTDALGHKTQNDYDPLNRLASTLQDVGGIAADTKFGYDALDNLTKVTDPKGLDTTYAYNGLGDLTKLTSPDTGVTNYTYDSAGNRATRIDARNIKTTYSYDALNRLTKLAYPTTSLNVSYTYDVSQATCASGETYAIGRLARMQDGSGSTDYCYDRFGDLVRKVQTTNGKVFVLRYAYTKAGQLSRLTYPDGATVDYVRNAQGQTTEVGVTPAGGTRQVLLNNATYYPFGPVASWSYGNGRPMQRVLDQDYRPLAINDTRSDGLSTGFAFDPAGNLRALTAAGNTAPVVSLDYDALGRLTAFKDGPTGTVIDGYSYDATGNRLSAKVNTVTQSYTYPTTSHRLSAVAGTARTYDAIGNTLSIGGTAQAFAYDATGRMSQAKRAGTVVMKYVYNGRGEQVRRVDKTNTYTLYDESGHWLGNYDANGTTLQQAIWLDDLPVGVLANNSLRYVQPDHLGSPRAVIDPSRDVAIWKWDLKGEAFGNTPPDQDPDKDGTAFVFDMRFPGQRYDAATGLNQNYFRDYDAGTGRYGQSDPIGLGGGISTYGYAFGSPLSFIDPLGLAPDPACAAAWIATCTVVGGGVGYWGGGILGGVAGSEVPVAGNAAGFVVGSQLGGMGGAAAGGVIGGATASAVCPEEKNCPPCKLIDGASVVPGTIGYRHDLVPPSKPHSPFVGDHYNLYRANQNPNNCQCFWQSIGAADAAGGLPPPPGSIPIQPFVN
ncbi:RHS repeat protein, partial [Xanthomonas translucens pv. translucens]